MLKVFKNNAYHFAGLAIMLTALAIGSNKAAFAQSTNVKRIGLSLPLSGSAQALGEQFLAGAKLALEIYNKSNPIPVSLHVVNDGCTKEVGQLAADELLALSPPVTIVTGYLCNEPAYVAADSFKDVQLPILVAGAQSERLIKDREREGWKLWKLSADDNDLAEKAAEIFESRWQGKPYAIVDDGTVHGRTLADTFRAAMEAKGLPPHFNDNFRPTQSTQARLVRRLGKAGVNNVFIGADTEDIIMIANNSQELGIPLEIVGSDVVSIMPYVPIDRRPIGSIYGIFEIVDNNSAFIAALKKELEKLEIEPDDYVFKGYAAMQIAIAAIGDSHQDTQSNLSLRNFDTILGPIEFAPSGANKNIPFALHLWQDQKFIQISK